MLAAIDRIGKDSLQRYFFVTKRGFSGQRRSARLRTGNQGRSS
jgi:hypothetical protein